MFGLSALPTLYLGIPVPPHVQRTLPVSLSLHFLLSLGSSVLTFTRETQPLWRVHFDENRIAMGESVECMFIMGRQHFCCFPFLRQAWVVTWFILTQVLAVAK